MPASAAMSTMKVVREERSLRQEVARLRDCHSRVALVPTMGALHAGHVSLLEVARQHAGALVVSIFVNPTQFGPGEDFSRYPRQLAEDSALLDKAGCDLLFVPDVATMYPAGASTFVNPEGPASGLEGSARPGHFRGVATVVCTLFHLVQAGVAVFGEKDAQQLAVIRRMVRDLHVPIEIVGAPIIREEDGLAMSSRNVYLSAQERQAATVLSRALFAASAAIEDGERDAARVRSLLRAILGTEPLARVDYAEVVDADTFQPVSVLRGSITLPLAVRIGGTRLIDNIQRTVDGNDPAAA
jgi:pantoate--beta-alanine ligase